MINCDKRRMKREKLEVLSEHTHGNHNEQKGKGVQEKELHNGASC